VSAQLKPDGRFYELDDDQLDALERFIAVALFRWPSQANGLISREALFDRYHWSALRLAGNPTVGRSVDAIEQALYRNAPELAADYCGQVADWERLAFEMNHSECLGRIAAMARIDDELNGRPHRFPRLAGKPYA
jgi:hypothetical protein